MHRACVFHIIQVRSGQVSYSTYHHVIMMRLIAYLLDFNNKYIYNIEASLNLPKK